MIGIQVHRQISYHKLFCKCVYNPKQDDKNVKTFYAIMRSTSDVKIDLDKSIEDRLNLWCYDYSEKSCCKYELEQIPPILNKKILKKAYKLIKGFQQINIKPVFSFERKEILDGSTPTGYQITGILATGGFITLRNNKKVLLKEIRLETDSSTKKDVNCYLLNRLNVPLLEVTTLPVDLTPLEVIEACTMINDILTRYHNIPVHQNAIRQDINISTLDSPITEIKGIDKLSLIPVIIEAELNRKQIEKTLTHSTRKVDLKAPYKTTFMRVSEGLKRIKIENELPNENPIFYKTERVKTLALKNVANNHERKFLENYLTIENQNLPKDLEHAYNISRQKGLGKGKKAFKNYCLNELSLEDLKKGLIKSNIKSTEIFNKEVFHPLFNKKQYIIQNKNILSREQMLRLKNIE